MPVQLSDLHKVDQVGDDEMEKQEVKPKQYQFGNTVVIIHSKLAHMTKEEQRNWFKSEWEKGNPVLRNISRAIFQSFQSSGEFQSTKGGNSIASLGQRFCKKESS
ncbi:hypothetical protein [Thermoflavimicrobium daqui]|uniref:Uncharacterized protein n=1 Tax=Thermoflavimicrobium daqui TaxID=2137476 RepID=A0A364K2D8_9BACL|nr:hypothetical protein [Thermoflavimicrobium daqui]RAL22563.1 hypothetical protein DL897_14220 [Thermoflavimicrobium daqui]